MMYHFMFGLTFSCAGAWPSSADTLLFSSAILKAFRCRLLLDAMQHPVHSRSDCLVDNEKINTEQDHRDDHHDRRRLDLFPAGESDFPHLVADVRQKSFDSRRKLRDFVAFVLPRHCYRLRHWVPSLKALSF